MPKNSAACRVLRRVVFGCIPLICHNPFHGLEIFSTRRVSSAPRSNVSEMAVSANYYITESPWLISIQLGWEAKIENTDLPYWMRLYAVAMARSKPNLHTPMESGELARLLGKKQPDGSTKPVDRRDLNQYIKRAVELKFLDETSSVRCLVLPAPTTVCRRPGWRRPCAHHTGQASRIKRPIAIKQPISTPLIRVNSSDTSPQFTGSAVGEAARQCRAEGTPTPGSRDIFVVKPRQVEGVSA
jgi:hypothetical protein